MNTTFWIQLLGVIFGSSMLYFTFVRFKRKELSSLEFGIWFTGWIILIFIAIKPSLLDFFIVYLHFYRRMDFFVVLGFFTLLGLGFYNYCVSKRLERKMEIFVRKDAMERHETERLKIETDETKK